MQGSTITGTVTMPVVLGIGPYDSPLRIDAGGAILPATAGATALTAPFRENCDFVGNSGLVLGGTGSSVPTGTAGVGGDGVVFGTAAWLFNYGEVSGGNGGDSTGTGGLAGIGFYATQPASVVNSGTITGGTGGYGDTQGGQGGVGVLLAQTGTLINLASGLIEGGGHGSSSSYYTGENGGAAIIFENGGRLSNRGTILGSEIDKAAVLFGGTGTLVNSGVILTRPGEIGVQMAEGGTIENAGLIAGGNAQSYGPLGSGPAVGVMVLGTGHVENAGTITGGAGSFGYFVGQSGSAALILGGANETLLNAGDIQGGNGGFALVGRYGGLGGDGADVSPGDKISNAGIIAGGNGDGGWTRGSGGNGVLISNAILLNNGIIVGGGSGAGGNGGAGVYMRGGYSESSGIITGGYVSSIEYGGTGGGGVVIDGGKFVMRGGFVGGARAATYGRGAGGVGVVLDGGTFEAIRGTIAGGANSLYGAGGEAVQFNTSAATLIVHAGVVFDGAVRGDYGGDTLVLMAGGTGTLSAFGVPGGITGIGVVDESSGGHWTIQGSVGESTSITVATQSCLILGGPASSPLMLASGGADRLILAAPSDFGGTLIGWGPGDDVFCDGLHATSFTVSDGMLSLMDSAGETLATLEFAPSDTAANFALMDDRTGTDVTWRSGGGSAPTWHGFWHMPITL